MCQSVTSAPKWCVFLHCRTNLYTGFKLPDPIMNWVHLKEWYGASSGCWRRRPPPGMEVIVIAKDILNNFRVWHPRCVLITVYKEWVK